MFSSVVATAVSVFLITSLGAFLRRIGRLSDQVDSCFMWLTINLLYPALIVNSILKNPALDVVENIWLPPLMGFSSVLIGLFFAFCFYRFSGLAQDKERRSFLLSNSLNNYGFLPIPVILALYNRETLGVVFVHNIGVDAAIWSIGILVVSAHFSLKEGLKRLFNAPLCTIAVSVFLTYFDLDEHVPSFVFKTSGLLGQAAIPMSLLLVGSLMYEAQKSVRMQDGVRVSLCAIAIRLMLFPACYLALIWLIPMTQELKQVMLVEAAQPAAMLPIVLARQYDASPQVAFIVLMSTSVVSLITMPLWIHFGTHFIL